jgi:hypothetical protein
MLSRRAKDDGVLIELGYLSPINYERRHEEQAIDLVNSSNANLRVHETGSTSGTLKAHERRLHIPIG